MFSIVLEWLQGWFTVLPGAIAQGMIWGIMAIGVYITYKILDLADLTVDGSMCTGMAVCAILTTNGVNIWVSMAVAVLAGILAGLITGLFHTFMGIPAILAGILTQLMLWSINLKIMGGANIALPARSLKLVVSGLMNKGYAIVIIAAFCIVIMALLYWFFGTQYGCAVRATGSNNVMSKAQGININNTKIFGFMLSNAIVALSGALLSQYQGNADINNGRGAIVIGLAAVIIGEAIISKLSQNFGVRLLGVIAGGVVYYIVYATVIYAGMDTDLLKMLSALVVAIFLAVPYWRSKFFSRAKNIEKEEVEQQ